MFEKEHSQGIVNGTEQAQGAIERIESACKTRTYTTQYVGRSGPAHTRDYAVSCAFDTMWDISLQQATYMHNSMGRYAPGVGKGKAKPHESRSTHQKRTQAYNVGAGRADLLARNTENLKYWIFRLIKSKGKTARTGIISEIMEIVESTYGLEIPAFMEEPKNLVSAENAANTVSLMYSMFSLVSRDVKKYYLGPRIKHIQKTWNIRKPMEKPETMESLKKRIMAQCAEKPEMAKKRIILERPHTRVRPHVSKAHTARALENKVSKCGEGVETTPAVPKRGKPWLAVSKCK